VPATVTGRHKETKHNEQVMMCGNSAHQDISARQRRNRRVEHSTDH